MTAQICPVHHQEMETVASEPISRCPNCHYATHHLTFEHCPQCGRRMQVEEPEPRYECPLCPKAEHRSVAI